MIEAYKNNGFYNSMILLLVNIIRILIMKYNFINYELNLLFNNSLEVDELIYIIFGIDITGIDKNILNGSNYVKLVVEAF